MSSVFVTLQDGIHAVARAAIQEITRAVSQGQSEVPFDCSAIRTVIWSLPPEQEAILCAIGMRGIRPLLAATLWEDFGLTMGRRHGGTVTVRGARQGTLAAELRQQLRERRH